MERQQRRDNHIMEKLIPLLHSLAEKEERVWQPVFYPQIDNKGYVTGIKRDEGVQLMICMNQAFNLLPESLSLGISLLDKFLNICKVQEKYINVVSISCWFVAVKAVEESHPTAYEVVQQARGIITKAELLRMERIILRKLDYDTRSVCSVEVLHVLHSLLRTAPSSETCHSSNLKAMTIQLLKCLSWHNLGATVKPSLLALSIITVHLEMVSNYWESMARRFCSILNADMEYLIGLNEQVGRFIATCYEQIKPERGSTPMDQYPIE